MRVDAFTSLEKLQAGRALWDGFLVKERHNDNSVQLTELVTGR